MATEEGIAQGRARGTAEGKAEGKAEVAIRLLTHRFGELDADVHRRVSEARMDELDAIFDRIFAARTLAEALG